MVEGAKKWMAKKGLDKPIWLSEYGWPSGGNYPTATDLPGQAENLVRFQSAAAVAGVKAAFWYCSNDWHDPEDVDDPTASEGFFGLAYPTAGEKPGALAYRVMAKILPGSQPVAELAQAFATKTGLGANAFRQSDGSIAYVATNRTKTAVVLPLDPGAEVRWPLAGDPALATAGQVTVDAGRSVVLVVPAP